MSFSRLLHARAFVFGINTNGLACESNRVAELELNFSKLLHGPSPPAPLSMHLPVSATQRIWSITRDKLKSSQSQPMDFAEGPACRRSRTSAAGDVSNRMPASAQLSGTSRIVGLNLNRVHTLLSRTASKTSNGMIRSARQLCQHSTAQAHVQVPFWPVTDKSVLSTSMLSPRGPQARSRCTDDKACASVPGATPEALVGLINTYSPHPANRPRASSLLDRCWAGVFGFCATLIQMRLRLVFLCGTLLIQKVLRGTCRDDLHTQCPRHVLCTAEAMATARSAATQTDLRCGTDGWIGLCPLDAEQPDTEKPPVASHLSEKPRFTNLSNRVTPRGSPREFFLDVFCKLFAATTAAPICLSALAKLFR